MSDVLKAKNMKRSLLLAIVLFCAEILFAQKGKEEAGIIFNPHWYLQLQGGMGYVQKITGRSACCYSDHDGNFISGQCICCAG